ncbi:EAL domain-containing protein (putative c-di-GMP-specific phosphodiesterase class I) [Paucimonas lemoignei]|uniref:EAL domain-containing protein (Putative c-di-GMP-specific phosphodiesterase class I) n=1 Tax=Paucimonas lemoignei TaxID=29443 RepID=A0A4R3HT86_PAULE|nr:EAL domain-containing protein [Paucimonas lemoignei]TCS36367.1 EAL domain-containing protein (putative c-di-GMP-specific phosphodiesterase class I) [Paucimonas lemoignei]
MLPEGSFNLAQADVTAQKQKPGCTGCNNEQPLGFDFEFAFQPIVDLENRTIFAHEALVRGPNGESAQSVLAQVHDKNRYQFDQACRVKAVASAARLGMTTFLSINFLPNAVYQPEACIQSTLKAARDHNFPHDRIIFEVVESEQVLDRAHLLNIFKKYASLGFHTAIDDFGAGYSGLNLLSEFQPTILKLDMDLIRNIDTNPARQAIVKGIVLMSDMLNIRLVAEGIETREEKLYLQSIGIKLMQGYFFCKPAFKALGDIPEHAWE